MMNNLVKSTIAIWTATIKIMAVLCILDWTGRAIRTDKSGTIPYQLQPTLQRLHIEADTWMNQVNNFGKRFYQITGTKQKIKTYALKIGLKWMNGQVKSSIPEAPS